MKRVSIIFMVILVFACSSDGASQGKISKKGLGINPRLINPEWLKKMNVSWAYSWDLREIPNLPPSVEFVPQVWTLKEGWKINPIYKIDPKYTYVMGFNEPDGVQQANMSVDEAIQGWEVFKPSQWLIGSPSTIHADNEWMVEFMEKAKEKKLQIDFVAIHYYGPPDLSRLEAHLKKIYKMYQKPIWITEFGVADWKAAKVSENRYSESEVANFMKSALKKLDQIEYVHRYAWFTFRHDHPYGSCSALWDEDGELTKVGKVYAEH